MKNVRFEWDVTKDEANQRKHGVGFEEAAQVFLDPLQVADQDRVEGGEQRWRTIGMSAGFVMLVVAHTTPVDFDRKTTEVIRIISARRATRKERQRYEDEDG